MKYKAIKDFKNFESIDYDLTVEADDKTLIQLGYNPLLMSRKEKEEFVKTAMENLDDYIREAFDRAVNQVTFITPTLDRIGDDVIVEGDFCAVMDDNRDERIGIVIHVPTRQMYRLFHIESMDVYEVHSVGEYHGKLPVRGSSDMVDSEYGDIQFIGFGKIENGCWWYDDGEPEYDITNIETGLKYGSNNQ